MAFPRLPLTRPFFAMLAICIVALFSMKVIFIDSHSNRLSLLRSMIAIKDENSTLTSPIAITANTPKRAPQLHYLQDPSVKCDDQSRPLPKKKVAIISATTPHVDNEKCALGNVDCSYAFYLPLTSLSWRRLGYSTAAIIAGDDKPWLQNGTHLNFVYETLQSLGDVTVIFMPTSNELKTGIAQIGRVFVPDIEPFSLEPDTFMVTSDVDLFPVSNIYDLDALGKDVRLTNGFCCDPFPHKGETIPMVALSSVGMRISTWHSVMNYRSISNDSNPVERIKTALMDEFGHLPYNASRGPNNEWFFDQQIVSIHLHHWFTKAKTACRRTDFTGSRIRWDRVGWPSHQAKEEWFRGHDAHCPLPGHIWDHFKALEELAQLIAGDALNVTVYWHKYSTLMGAKVPSLQEVVEKVSNERGNGGFGGMYHRPELGN